VVHNVRHAAGPLTQCAIDIVFTRCKPAGSRRLPFKEFLEAVAAVADEAGCSFDAVTATLSGVASPPESLTASPLTTARDPSRVPVVAAGFLSAGGLAGSLRAPGGILSSLSVPAGSPVRLPGPPPTSPNLVGAPKGAGDAAVLAASAARSLGSHMVHAVHATASPPRPVLYSSADAVANPLFEGDAGEEAAPRKGAGTLEGDVGGSRVRQLEGRVQELESRFGGLVASPGVWCGLRVVVEDAWVMHARPLVPTAGH